MISKEIKKLRDSLGISQNEFANILGVSFATVNRWENEKCEPDNKQKEQIEALSKLSDNKEVDMNKLKSTLIVAGIGGTISLAAAAGYLIATPMGYAIKGLIASVMGKPDEKNMSKLFKKDKKKDEE